MKNLIICSLFLITGCVFGNQSKGYQFEGVLEEEWPETSEQQIDYCIKKMYAYSLLDDKENFLHYMRLLRTVAVVTK